MAKNSKGKKTASGKIDISQGSPQSSQDLYNAPPSHSPTLISHNFKYILALPVSLITLVVYLFSLNNKFVNWDDNLYVYDNFHLRSLDLNFFKWAFTDVHTTSNWHPITWISHALDYAVWGLNPMGHHLTSIIFHAINTFLVVVLVERLLASWQACKLASLQAGKPASSYDSRLTLIAAAVTGLLFGLHPIHVESVAWISERKDVLCAFFFLSGILSYLKYADKGENDPFKAGIFNKHYLLTYVFFVFALMSKPMAVTLPAVLLVLDWFPLERIKTESSKVFKEKIPLFAISLAASVITIQAHTSDRNLVLLQDLSLPKRLLVAVHALIFYLWKMALPINLYPFYPYPPDISLLSVNYFLSITAVIWITVFCIYRIKKEKFWFAVWISYVIMLLPVLGIIQTGEQAAADRYSYLPGIGPSLVIGLAVAWGYHNIIVPRTRKSALKSLAALLAFGMLFSLSYLTVKQTGIWKDGLTLWNYIIAKEPTVYFAYNNRGISYEEMGQYDKAIADYNTSIALKRDFFRPYENRGVIYNKKGMYDLAIEDFDKVIALKPEADEAYAYRGVAYDKKGLFERAMEDFRKAIAINPGSYRTYINLGVAYEGRAMFDEAIQSYNLALVLNPYSDAAFHNRGVAYYRKGLYREAIADYSKAIALNKDFKEAYYNRAAVYMRTGMTDKAAEDLRNFKIR